MSVLPREDECKVYIDYEKGRTDVFLGSNISGEGEEMKLLCPYGKRCLAEARSFWVGEVGQRHVDVKGCAAAPRMGSLSLSIWSNSLFQRVDSWHDIMIPRDICYVDDLLLSISTSMGLLLVSVILISLPLPLALLPIRELFSLKTETISLRGTNSGNVHQELRTVAARVDSSERECRIFDTVSPPRENARSTSVEVAK